MEQITQALTNIGFDLRLAVAHFINFLVVFVVLTKFVFKPLAAKIDERNQIIDKGLRDAEEAKQELLRAEAEREKVLQSARQDAQAVLAEAKHRDEAMHEEAVKKAQEEGDRLRAKTATEIENAKEKAEADFRQEAAELVTSAAKKLVAEDKITENEAKKVLTNV